MRQIAKGLDFMSRATASGQVLIVSVCQGCEKNLQIRIDPASLRTLC
jgi:hypothetical protein